MIKHWNMVSSLTEMGSSPKIFRHKTGLIGLIGMIDLYNSSIFPRGQTIKIGFRPRKDGWSVVNIGNIHPSRGMIRIHKECETTEPHSELQIGPWEVWQYEPQKGLQHLTTSSPWKLNLFLDVFVVYQYLIIRGPRRWPWVIQDRKLYKYEATYTHIYIYNISINP